MTKSILDPNRSYTFSNYFDLGFIPSDLVAEFGYTLTKQLLKLPEYSGELNRMASLKQRIEEVLPYIDSENAAIPNSKMYQGTHFADTHLT